MSTDLGYPSVILSPPLPVVQALVQALIERRAAVGISDHYSLSQELNILPLCPCQWYMRTGGYFHDALTPMDFAKTFDHWLNATIEYYAKPEALTTDYTGNADIPHGQVIVPCWQSLTEICTALGEELITTPYLAPQFFSAWAMQRIRMLNQLYVTVQMDADANTFRSRISLDSDGITNDQGAGWDVSGYFLSSCWAYSTGLPSVMFHIPSSCRNTFYIRTLRDGEDRYFPSEYAIGYNCVWRQKLITPSLINNEYRYTDTVRWPADFPWPTGCRGVFDVGNQGGCIVISDYSAPGGFKFRSEDW